jgi:hypothetical protein
MVAQKIFVSRIKFALIKSFEINFVLMIFSHLIVAEINLSKMNDDEPKLSRLRWSFAEMIVAELMFFELKSTPLIV